MDRTISEEKNDVLSNLSNITSTDQVSFELHQAPEVNTEATNHKDYESTLGIKYRTEKELTPEEKELLDKQLPSEEDMKKAVKELHQPFNQPLPVVK